MVAPDWALQYSLDQLKRIVAEFNNCKLFIVSPMTRYISQPCCSDLEPVTNFGEPNFLSNIISDLTELKYQLRKTLHPAMVLDSIG